MCRATIEALSTVLLLCVPGATGAEPIAAEVAVLWNLCENSGFEKGKVLPAYWNRHPPTDAGGHRLARDTSVAHWGRASGLILGAPHAPGAAAPNLQWNRYGIEVEGGSALVVSCWVKTEGTLPLRVGCHFYDADRRHLGFKGVRLPEREGEWVYLRDRIEVPDDARRMGFVLYASAPGKTWYDDVAVLATPRTEAARGTPRLDGKLDDACWTAGRAISSFVVDSGARLARAATRAWLAYDDTALYAAFCCPHAPGGAWRDDSVEVLLDPDHAHRDILRLCIDSRGRIDGARGAEAAVHEAEDAWNVEIKIPYDPLGVNLNTPAVWGLNLVRNDRTCGETVTWSLEGINDAKRLGNVGLRPDLWRFRRAEIAKELSRREEEVDRLRREMRAAGMSDQAMSAPNRLLAKGGAEVNAFRRRVDGLVRDDEAVLAELRRSLAGLAKVVPEARSVATQFMLATPVGEPGGFRVSIAHSLQKVPRGGPWNGGVFANRVELDAAADETESFQLVVMPAGGALKGLAVEAPALEGPGGCIPVTWHREDYVETIEPRYPTDYVGWWPDPLLPPGPVDVAAGQRQPLWLSVSVPADARPGKYAGRVTLRHGRQCLAVPVELRVRRFRLPRPGTLATAFGNYANALSENCFGPGDYRQKMRPSDFGRWCEFMGRYRIGAKNAGRDYVSVARDGDAWRADLSALATTIGGVAPKYYAPYSVGIYRLPSAPQLLEPGKAPDTSAWAGQVGAVAAAWRRAGLPRQAFVYGIDEPRPAQYPLLVEAYGKVRAAVPDFPIMQTIGDRQPAALAGLVGIWCPLSSQLDSDFYAQRRQAGDTLWTYVCCSPRAPYANFFIDRPAVEHRVLFWQTWQHGATGFLYWCVCYWNGLPLGGRAKPCWPEVPLRLADLGTAKKFRVNGDGVLLYPGPGFTPYASLRLEVIRDGIEDYEYLALLSRLVQDAKALAPSKRPARELLARAEELCRVPAEISQSMAQYTNDPNAIFERRKAIAEAIEELSATLNP